MRISFDPNKRRKTLHERGLDFADAARIFAGPHFENLDDRFDYGEDRYITVGLLDGIVVVIVWTQRGQTRRIISMRKANAKETQSFFASLG
ncbi:MAG: BrnT family toxin [Reyranellaceae bacterium]